MTCKNASGNSGPEAGSKLVFIDLVQDGQRVQGLCNLNTLSGSGAALEDFQRFYHIARRGDIYAITGFPHRTSRGELSITATKLPQLLTPSLRPLPTEILDPATRMRNRHLDMLVTRRTSDTLRLRSYLIQALRSFLLDRNFLEVGTPLLADGAGGAIARPFITSATEFPEKRLSLRIAPELWLKRLVIGDMDRVFEIGPCFRNEGLDTTHNPEFTTCEFYAAYTGIEELMAMSEEVMVHLARETERLKAKKFPSLPAVEVNFQRPFKRIDFIPALEAALSITLPDFSSPDAQSSILKTFTDLAIPPPNNPTLPRLLDKLASLYIEPQCTEPSFIVQAPECLSPLSKSYIHPHTSRRQRVSARAELFVHGRELLNTYEEENSPFEQRRKFEEQMKLRTSSPSSPPSVSPKFTSSTAATSKSAPIEATDAEEGSKGATMEIDESYISALEHGLPPTGGWGCGIDRLVMLFAGAARIGDVLPFGNLRNVVALGSGSGSGNGNGSAQKKS
ncbi:MAG: hypothetical protein M1838_001593 [Thelocarpon superellum]|nr:MAG: hypothetical protein M1838_001593 [Thelocarpon superellum]